MFLYVNCVCTFYDALLCGSAAFQRFCFTQNNFIELKVTLNKRRLLLNNIKLEKTATWGLSIVS